MTGLTFRFLLRLTLPLFSFTFLAVPLESYIQAIDGVFNINLKPVDMLCDSLFFHAAACFYCITVLFECVVILSRPHMRNSDVPITDMQYITLVVSALLVAAYIYITRNVIDGSINKIATVWFLSVAIVLTCIFSFLLHYIDYKFSEAAVAGNG
jgi:hypothetical protein